MRSAARYWQTKYYWPTKPKLSFFGNWSLFSFPDEGNFNAAAIVGPRWKIYFFQPGTTIPSPVAAESTGTLRHAHPVQVDRFGSLPTIYTNTINTYDISVRNEFGVEKHLIEDY